MTKLVCCVAAQNIHWVLDRIAKEVGSRFSEDTLYCYDLYNIPQAEHYFVTHYSLLPRVLGKVNPVMSKVHCFFTHESVPVASLVHAMNLCASVICENEVEFKRLIAYGINPSILHMVPEGANPEMFKPHARTGEGSILISSACYPRKNPELLKSVINLLPNRKFILVGKDWKNLPSNVEYHENFVYESYPGKYSYCDIFLSCATLEGGGPAGLIEAMHANLVPVVSDTGNAHEYITNGYNGFIFPINENPEEIVKLIEKSYTLSPQNTMPYNDIWQTVRQFTWDAYALQMKEIMLQDYSKTTSQNLDFLDE